MKALNLSFDNDVNTNTGFPGMHQDFIGTYPNALSPEFCKEVIEAFDYYHFAGGLNVWQEDDQFPVSNAGRFDWALELPHMAPRIYGYDPSRELNDVLSQCLTNYVHQYGHMKAVPLVSYSQKVQKTPAGGGYHVWHDENSGITDSGRAIVWMFYLNDNFEGGETEFLYYSKRIQPRQGTLLLWPAGLTHAHRGGLVTSGNKYVITGWFYVTEGHSTR